MGAHRAGGAAADDERAVALARKHDHVALLQLVLLDHLEAALDEVHAALVVEPEAEAEVVRLAVDVLADHLRALLLQVLRKLRLRDGLRACARSAFHVVPGRLLLFWGYAAAVGASHVAAWVPCPASHKMWPEGRRKQPGLGKL